MSDNHSYQCWRLSVPPTGSGGQLGSASSARYKAYTRLKAYIERSEHTLFPAPPELQPAVDDIYRFHLLEYARDTISRQIRSGISDEDLAKLVISLHTDNRLCQVHEDQKEPEEPRIICSLGLFDMVAPA